MPATVLIIEDNDDLLLLYRTALEQKGHTVIEARGSAEAVRLLQASDSAPHVVFLDIEMPDAPGTHVLDFIRSDGRFNETKIMVITANEIYRERIGNKVDQYIVKPVAISRLLSLVDSLTG